MVSAQSATSPLCRSPLSQSSFPRRAGVLPIPDTSSSKRDRQKQADTSSSSDDEEADYYAPPTVARRPSGTTIALSPRRLSTSRSLAGSYTLSLLSSRMSAAHPTHHVPSAFTLKLSSVSPGKGVPSGLKCPQHVKIAFDARWYALDSSSSPAGAGAGAAWTPWVGNVDVEEHYARQYRNAHPQHSHKYDHDDERIRPDAQCASSVVGKGNAARPRPGYQVGASGKIQLFIMQTVVVPPDQSASSSHPRHSITQSSTTTIGKTTPVKVFLVDYDLSSLQPGGRLLYKERAYQTLHSEDVTSAGKGDGKGREVLKYAIELQFLCVAKRKMSAKNPAPPTMTTTTATEEPATSTTDKKRKRPDNASLSSTAKPDTGNPHTSASYYLGKQIRLVFPTNSSALHPTDGPLAVSAPTTTSAARRYSSGVAAAPTVRIERLIEVQNPPPPPAPLPPPPQAGFQPLPRTSTTMSTESQAIGKARNPTVAAAYQRRESAGLSFSGSLTSESWDGLRARWDMEAGRAAAAASTLESALSSASSVDVQAQGDNLEETQDTSPRIGIIGLNGQHPTRIITPHNGARPHSPKPTSIVMPTPATASSGLVFTRSPTPVVGGLSLLKSPSLLTARLEEMSGSEAFTTSLSSSAPPSALGDEQGSRTEHYDGLRVVGVNGNGGGDSTRASGAGRRKAPLWPALGAGDEDHERLLSESLKKLPISYHR
ncbi:hypothetical protein QFC24_001645 [Naganishia onofrii]|uniref:Uncharacterized protein n=1 Tax=Naganishia onofrii TaxID=1851511 RepID=A0ACC2XT98_9TREE|nr:hypothetical protein QFC24_001645 [Naganishia onofrii]